MVLKTAGLVEVLRRRLGDLPGITLAFVCGSTARLEHTPESDVDLIVVGDATVRDLAGPLREAEQTLARDVNPTLYPEAEFWQKMAEGHRFLTSVMGEPKLFVIGDADVLARLAETGGSEGTHA